MYFFPCGKTSLWCLFASIKVYTRKKVNGKVVKWDRSGRTVPWSILPCSLLDPEIHLPVSSITTAVRSIWPFFPHYYPTFGGKIVSRPRFTSDSSSFRFRLGTKNMCFRILFHRGVLFASWWMVLERVLKVLPTIFRRWATRQDFRLTRHLRRGTWTGIPGNFLIRSIYSSVFTLLTGSTKVRFHQSYKNAIREFRCCCWNGARISVLFCSWRNAGCVRCTVALSAS